MCEVRNPPCTNKFERKSKNVCRTFLELLGQRKGNGLYYLRPTPAPLPPLGSWGTCGGGVHTTHSPGGEGGGGSIFWKTPDIGLASYSIIPQRGGETQFRRLDTNSGTSYRIYRIVGD
jgi:hypothetical protein